MSGVPASPVSGGPSAAASDALEVGVPDGDVPEVDVPEVDVPEVDVPEVDVPEVMVLDIGAIAHGGQCVARTPAGQVVFVRHTLPGERVRVRVTQRRRGFLRADAVEVLRAAAGRVEPPCPWSGPGRCGGCDFQHVALDVQRDLKAAVVREQLLRLGGLSPDELRSLAVEVAALPPVPGQPDGLGWRTRIKYRVDRHGRPGLLKHRSHDVVAIDRCRIAYPAVQAADVNGVGIMRRRWPDFDALEVVAGTESGPRSGTESGPQSGTESGPQSGPGSGQVTVVGRRRGARPVRLAGPARVRQSALGRRWRLAPAAFWQVHPAAATTLAASVVELLAPMPGERAWDLYGGAGLFSAALAAHLGEGGRLTMVESDPAAVAAARSCLADLATVNVVCSDVERALADPRWTSVDLVVLDPPRSGAGPTVLGSIIARAPRAVAYVACDPAALARDVRTVREAGWRLVALQAFDLFPHTHHVECVALLRPG